jgi:hypothetical protein
MADLTLAQIQALLADNTTGDISAADVRDVSTALYERTDGTNAVEAIQFDTVTPDVPGAHTPGHVHWNTTEGTLELMTGTPDVTLQLGHEQYIEVRNTTGATILNGRPVRITGGQADFPLAGLDVGQGQIVGVMTHDLTNNSNGKATTSGLVRDVDTSAFTDGAQVYASSTGTLTTTLTSSRVGYIVNAHPTNGTIQVLPDRRTMGSGTTAQRPTTVLTGFTYFDSTLGIPVFWNGTVWKNASGATV